MLHLTSGRECANKYQGSGGKLMKSSEEEVKKEINKSMERDSKQGHRRYPWKMLNYLGVSAKDFGMKTDPVIRDKQSALIKDIFLQGTSIT